MPGNVQDSAGNGPARHDRTALLVAVPVSLVGMAAYALPVLSLLEGFAAQEVLLSLVNRDFVNYWAAGHLIRDGQVLDLFDQEVYFSYLRHLFGPAFPIHNWGYPPHFLLLVWPLGYLGYKTGLVLFLGMTFGLFAFSVHIFRKAYAPAAGLAILVLAIVPYSLMMIDTTQNGFLTASLLLFGLAFMGHRPALAGLCFAVLTIKPQLGFLIPVLLVFERNWRAIGWTVFFFALLVALSVATFGVESWLAYLTKTVDYQQYVMTTWHGIFLPMMPTAFASIRTLGLSPDTAFLVQWPVSVAAGAGIIWLLWRRRDGLERVFIVACGTFLVSPYGFNYDMGALAVIAALLAGRGGPGFRHGHLAIALVAVLPAAVMNLGRMHLPIAPLILALALVTLALPLSKPGLAAEDISGKQP